MDPVPVQIPDFKTVMLLLSVALGLSLTIERLLDTINGMISKWLLRDDSPFAIESDQIEVVLTELGFNKLDSLLDDKVEEIEELGILAATAPADKKESFQKKAKKLNEEALKLVERFKTLFAVTIEGANGKLTKTQKEKLQKKWQVLQNRINGGALDTSSGEYDEMFSNATVLVDPIAPRDGEKTARIFWLQILGTFGGILLCYISKFGIFDYILQNHAMTPKWDWILTGLLIGGGAQPIHTLIKFLTERKVTEMKVSDEAAVKTEEESAPEAPNVVAKPAMPSLEIDILYRGGVTPAKLEHRHLRQKDPDLIIYHHTAMHSDTTFADVVKVITDRGWSTGYNCVILKDGSVHPFCRWDRYGNHVKGYNRGSLGIAFNGNFEPDPKVSFSNVNGTLGILSPTDEQLLSACKVVALWCQLYNIPLDFAQKIIPHNQVANKACPGSNFPHDRFKKLVETTHNRWQKSEKAQEELELFSQKQYLFV